MEVFMEIGDLVQCKCEFVGYEENYDFPVSFPLANKIYTIRDIRSIGGFKGIVLEEITNILIDTEAFGKIEIQFDFNCFSLLPKADLSELKELL